ncbi:MAG: MASE3 domain-containing protein [Patescibacteria group bacterium]
MKEGGFLQNIKNLFRINPLNVSLWIFFLGGLYLSSLFSYELFHILVELLCVAIALGIFMIAWNARRFFDNHYLFFICISYLFIASIDLIHALAFKGMGVFDSLDSTPNIATQLWIAARYLQAISLVVAPIFLIKKMNVRLIFEIFILVTLSVFVAIFYLKIFPTAYIEATGLTLFKKVSEYIISAILVGAIFFLFKKRQTLNKNILYLILLSMLFTVVSELTFTTYFGVYDFSNMVGHYLKLVAFYLMYRAIIETGLKDPLTYIFGNLEQTAKTLRASELRFRTLIKLAINPMVLTDSKGNIMLCNDATEHVFGWKESEIVGKSFVEVFILKNKDKEDIKNLINKDGPKSAYERHELSSIRKNGEKFTFELSSSHWETDNESFFGFLMRDITDWQEFEKTLLKKNRTLKNMVENLGIFQKAIDGAFTHIVITNEKATILYANKAVEEITGFTKEEIIGKNPSLWGKQMPDSFYKDFWKTIKEDKKTFAGEIINKRKDGTLYDADIRVSPILDDKGNVRFFVGIERDITHEKEIDRAKTEFISLAAHQLRTPLSTISLTSEMLLKGVTGKISREGKKYLRNICFEIKDMAEMIEIFLNVSRIEMGGFQVNTESLSLIDVIEKTIKIMLPLIEKKNITFKKNYSKKPLVMNLDRKVMDAILENLFSNSIKYTHKGGEIKIKVQEKSKEVIIELLDSGIGIPKKEQSKIFTKLFRAGNVTQTKTGGSGLGLYLVKKLVDQSGYKIWFKSKENKGTTFFLSIPKTKIKLI